MKLKHKYEPAFFTGDYARHVWTFAGKTFCLGFGIITLRGANPLRFFRYCPGPNGNVVWFWRIGFGLRLKMFDRTGDTKNIPYVA